MELFLKPNFYLLMLTALDVNFELSLVLSILILEKTQRYKA